MGCLNSKYYSVVRNTAIFRGQLDGHTSQISMLNMPLNDDDNNEDGFIGRTLNY